MDGGDENEIEDSRRDDQKHEGAAKRSAAERKKLLQTFARRALEAKRAKDAGSFAYWLQRVGIREGSEEWKNAWKDFSS
jgi:hypothetical protein